MSSDAPERLPLIRRWRLARYARDFAAFEQLSVELLRRETAQQKAVEVRRALARFRGECGQQDEANRAWADLLTLDPHDFEAAFHIASAMVSRGLSAGAAVRKVASHAGSESFRFHLLSALETPAPAQASGAFRHIAICGVSYSGSTILDRILGSQGSVASIGESHWLTKTRGAEGAASIDFSASSISNLPHCSVCGADCPKLDLSFRRRLAGDRTGWYERIAARLGTETLISADKNLPKLVDNDPLLRFHALILFKSPEQAWLSHRNKIVDRCVDMLEECRQFAQNWTAAYSMMLDVFAPQFGTTYLLFDDFARNPESALPALVKALGVEVDPSVLSLARPGHAIGGNRRTLETLRNQEYEISIAPLATPSLSAEEKAVMAQTPGPAEVFARLRRNALAI